MWKNKVFLAEIKSFKPKKGAPIEYRASFFNIQSALEQLSKKIGIDSSNKDLIIEEIKSAFGSEKPNKVLGNIIQQGYFCIDNIQGFPVVNTFVLESFLINVSD